MTNVGGFSSKSKGNIKNPNRLLEIRPTPHSTDLSPPLFTSLPVVDEPGSSTLEESFLEDDFMNYWLITNLQY